MPLVNVADYLKSVALGVDMIEVITHPHHKVVLKHTLDQLVKKVWCKQFMNIGMWKTVCKWLSTMLAMKNLCFTDLYIPINTKGVPYQPGIKLADEIISFLMGPSVSYSTIQVIRCCIAPL